MGIINYFFPKELSGNYNRKRRNVTREETPNVIGIQQNGAWMIENGDRKMIEVTKLNDEKVIINSDLIETVEETPDTVISLSNGRKIIVKESRQEVRNLVILYKRECYVDLCKLFMSEERKQSGNDGYREN